MAESSAALSGASPIKPLSEADYAARLDPQMRAFVERTNAFYPADAVNLSIAGQREVYDRMAEEFRAARPGDVEVTDGNLPNGYPAPYRLYTRTGGARAKAAVLYLHGGGFVVGGLDSHDDVCAEICSRTGFTVVSVDYRLCPEHLHPAAFDDAMAGFAWLASIHDGPIVVAGDSAGGSLAAAVSHATRKAERRPQGQVLIYPGLGGNRPVPSHTEHAFAPLLTAADLDFYANRRTGGKEVTGDPTLAPLQDTDFSGLPPTIIIPAECDPLRDHGALYCQAITQAGGNATCLVQKGWLHGGLRARHMADVARRAFDVTVEAIARLGA